MIDPRGPRFAAWITTLVLAAVLLTSSPWLLLLQAVVFALGATGHNPYALFWKRFLRKTPPAELEPSAPPRFAQAVGLVFALVGLVGYSFLQASAKARIVNLCTNLGALAVFAVQGAPLWKLGLLMAACNVAGGWLGAHTAITRGSGFVRAVFLGVVALLVIRLAYDIVA